MNDTSIIMARARPCPFAPLGDLSEKHKLEMYADARLDVCYIQCTCGARSPHGERPSVTVEAWNNRWHDEVLLKTEGIAGRAAIRAQSDVDELKARFAAMQVENNKLLERARTAEAALQAATTLVEMAITDDR